MPLVGFTTEIYYDARPYERQTQHKGNNNNKQTLHTRQTSTQNNKYQVSHKHSYFS